MKFFLQILDLTILYSTKDKICLIPKVINLNQQEVMEFALRNINDEGFISINDIDIADYLGVDEASYKNSLFNSFCSHIHGIKNNAILVLIKSRYWKLSFNQIKDVLRNNNLFYPIRERNIGYYEATSKNEMKEDLKNLYRLSEKRYSTWFQRNDALNLKLQKLYNYEYR